LTESWRAWSVEVPRGCADELAGFLALEGVGTVLDPLGPDTVRLTLYGDDHTDYEAVCAKLAIFGVLSEPEPSPVEDRDWVAEYQRGLKTLPLGERFVVLPHEDCVIPDEWKNRTPIRLSPGRAFGTGEHPTTRLCARALEEFVQPGSRWLDVGAGSGILSIVAAHLGAQVDAVEIDPDASRVAEDVLAANPVAEPIRWHTGGIETAPGSCYDGLVINIFTSFFLREAA
jgi:ribosomal protein L11 methylase PrmA